jgi:hypothetical protein
MSSTSEEARIRTCIALLHRFNRSFTLCAALACIWSSATAYVTHVLQELVAAAAMLVLVWQHILHACQPMQL